MKTVFSKTAEVCAVWAAQSQAHARTGSNTSFRDRTLYSYGTAIARLVPDRNGRLVALINGRSYSGTTAIVQGQAGRAAREQGMPTFTVPVMDCDKVAHAANLKRFEERINEALNRVERAVKPDMWRKEAERLIHETHTYATYFKVRWTYRGRVPESVRSAKEREEK